LLKENWFFKRLPVIDRTIFFAIISEYTLIKTKKAILISEAMKIANSYAEFKTISYINPILEKILN
jgi:transcription termination factor NusB